MADDSQLWETWNAVARARQETPADPFPLLLFIVMICAGLGVMTGIVLWAG